MTEEVTKTGTRAVIIIIVQSPRAHISIRSPNVIYYIVSSIAVVFFFKKYFKNVIRYDV